MRITGWILSIIGLLVIAVALGTETSVPGGAGTFGRVANMSLMQQQSNMLSLGGVLFLSGCVLIGFASLSSRLESASDILRQIQKSGAPTPPEPIASSGDADHRFAIGDSVRHQAHGVGTVIELTRPGFASVKFDGVEVEVAERYLREQARAGTGPFGK